MDEADAIAGLERTEGKLRAYAAERGLVVRPELTWPGQPLPREQRGPVRFASWSVAGKLPGRSRRAAAPPGCVRQHLRDEASPGSTRSWSAGSRSRSATCRCSRSEPRDWSRGSSTGPATGARARTSAASSRWSWIAATSSRSQRGRTRHGCASSSPRASSTGSPSTTPVDFGFRLDGGVFTCECPQYRGQHRADGEVDEEHLDLLAGAGGRAASRIRDEVLEEADTSWGGTNPDSAAAHAARADGPQARSAGRAGAEAGGRRRARRERRPASARSTGWSPRTRPSFTRTTFACRCRERRATCSPAGCPAQTRKGELAWLEFSSAVDMQRNYNAIVIERRARAAGAVGRLRRRHRARIRRRSRAGRDGRRARRAAMGSRPQAARRAST